MADIVDVSGNRRLRLNGEEFARTFSFGQRWNKLKIGVTFGINGAATVVGVPTMGVCSGTTNILMSATTDGFLGTAAITYAAAPTWTYSTAYVNAGGASRTITRINTTTTDTSATTSVAWGIGSAPTQLSQWFITLTRTSWNVITQKTSCASGDAMAALVIPDYWFYRNAETNVTTATYGVRNDFDTNAGTTWAGPGLDSFSFSWQLNLATADIGHVIAIRQL